MKPDPRVTHLCSGSPSQVIRTPLPIFLVCILSPSLPKGSLPSDVSASPPLQCVLLLRSPPPCLLLSYFSRGHMLLAFSGVQPCGLRPPAGAVLSLGAALPFTCPWEAGVLSQGTSSAPLLEPSQASVPLTSPGPLTPMSSPPAWPSLLSSRSARPAEPQAWTLGGLAHASGTASELTFHPLPVCTVTSSSVHDTSHPVRSATDLRATATLSPSPHPVRH